jgi:hypothetical protein
MKRLILSIIILYAFGYAGGREYLVRLDARSSEGRNVIELIDGQALATADDDELEQLAFARIPCSILDPDPRGKLYLLVFPVDGSVLDLGPYGTRLAAFEECVLLRTTEDQIPELNKLPVELARLNIRPLGKPDGTAPAYDDAPLAPDSLIQKMLNSVNPDSILNSVLRLQRFSTRYATSDSNRIACANWIRDRLIAYGCDSVYASTFYAGYGPNVVGIERGKLYPNPQRYCLIGGHFDDIPSSGYAPGADDNASGTTAMLEAARVMKDFNFENTVRFCGFNAEEQGLIGSDSLAAWARSQGDTIFGALCYDMIGYVTAPDSNIMRLRYTTAVPGCSLFACVFYPAIADTYNLLKIRPVRYTGTSGSSDHASYWRQGYVSTGGIERVLCPGYHTVGDSIGNEGFNNLAFAVQVIRTAVAVLAKLAVPIHSGSIVGDAAGTTIGPLFCAQPDPGRRFNIRFQVLSDRESVELGVYDAAGRMVKKLAQGAFAKGIHSVVWNGYGVSGVESPPGVYFAALNCGGRDRFLKITLVR